MKPAILVAYLHDATRDGRVITNLRFDNAPWPILDTHGQAVGRVSTLESDHRHVWATDYEFDNGDPDWQHWCLTLSLKDVETHAIVGATRHVIGTVAGFQLSPAHQWPWGAAKTPTRPPLDQRIGTVARTLREVADWPFVEMTRDEFLSLADVVEQLDPGDITCPICEEPICDPGCPLEGLRHP